jgi:tetratricopeptide (TPR) repeat protein
MTSQQVEMLYQQAMGFLKSKDPEKALKSLDMALKIDKKYLPALNNKGVALLQLEKYSEAVECFDKVIKQNPADNLAWYNKGYALFCQKNYTESIKALNIFISRYQVKDDFYKYGLYLEAKNYFELQKYKESLELVDKSLDIDKNFAEVIELKISINKILKQ